MKSLLEDLDLRLGYKRCAVLLRRKHVLIGNIKKHGKG